MTTNQRPQTRRPRAISAGACLSIAGVLTGLSLSAALAQTPPSAAPAFSPPLGAQQFSSPIAKTQTEARTKLTPADLRPPADMLVDCKTGPEDAKVILPPELAAWAAVYCTKSGYIFTANDMYYAAYPDARDGSRKGRRAMFDANALDDKPLDAPTASYFKTIAYGRLEAEDLAKLFQVDPLAEKIIGARTPWRLDLVTSGDRSLTLMILGPDQDPFWAFPVTAQGLGSPAFVITSLKLLNQAR